MSKSRVPAGAEVDRLIGELEQEFDLLRLRDLKTGLEREEERLAEEERSSRERFRPADAATESSVVPADRGVEKEGWWRALAGRVALWRSLWWIRVRRGTLVEKWRRLSLLERETEFAIRERRRFRTPR
jgi:hypothetical protein